MTRVLSVLLSSSLVLGAVAGKASSPPLMRDGEVTEIDPSKGEVDGRIALSFWPFVDSETERPVDPTGFEVHLTTEESQEEELVYACGTWFVPPPAKYKLWLEGPGWMSPYSSILRFRGGPFEGRGGVSKNLVVPAGRVALGVEVGRDERHSLRLLHLESHVAGGTLKREMSRRVVGDKMVDGVYLPEGMAIGALYDHRADEYVALTRPFEVARGETTILQPRRPAGTAADLLVVLERPDLVMDESEDDVELTAIGSAEEVHTPNVVVRTVDRIYAVWYDLSERFVTLEANSRSVYFVPTDVVLRPGKVESHRDRLRQLPNVDVDLVLPPDQRQERLTLSTFRKSNWEKVTEVELEAETTHHRLEGLPTERLWLSLRRSPWVFYEEVDLSDGEDGRVVFRPEPIEVSGTVYHGDRGHPARIRFRTDPRDPRDELEVETDDEGRYQASLFRIGYYVIFVELEGSGQPPFREYTPEPIRQDRILDFHVPANAFRVRVVDKESGAGIAGARVIADNDFEDNRGASHENVTDANGIAPLEPLRPGTVSVTAEASGYHASRDVIEAVVEGEIDREILVPLEPIEGGKRVLRLLLPDGHAAGDAELRLHNALDEHWPLWEGRTDQDGAVEVPASLGGQFLLARHPEAGSALRLWPPTGADGNGLAWQLPASAGPLDVRVSRTSGEPASTARIGIWIDSQRLSGNVLAWFAGALAGGTNAQGSWRAERLPAEPLRIMSWLPDADSRVRSGAMDSLAEELHRPWSDPIELTAFD